MQGSFSPAPDFESNQSKSRARGPIKEDSRSKLLFDIFEKLIII